MERENKMISILRFKKNAGEWADYGKLALKGLVPWHTGEKVKMYKAGGNNQCNC